MNKLIKVLNENIEQGKKSIFFRMDQEIFRPDTSKKELVDCLKENGICAIVLNVNVNLRNTIALAGVLETQLDMPCIIETVFHPVFLMGMKNFADLMRDNKVSAVHVPDLPMEEQGQLKVHLLDENGPFLVHEVSPASRDRSMQIMEYARGFVLASDEGDHSALMELPGDPLDFYLFAISASSQIPTVLDFSDDDPGKLTGYLENADGAILGNFMMPIFKKSGYNREKLEAYIKRCLN